MPNYCHRCSQRLYVMFTIEGDDTYQCHNCGGSKHPPVKYMHMGDLENEDDSHA